MSNVPSKSIQDNVPAHIQEDKVQGVDKIKNYVRPPRLKIVQFLKSDVYDKFDPGTILVVPQIQEIKSPFTFTPLFFFPEWCIWNPIQMKGQLQVIRERDLNPTGKLAQMSRSKDTRSFTCPENKDFNCTVAEHLNIIVMLHGDTPVQNVPTVMTFVRGEYTTGQTLLSMIQLRQKSIYACIFQAAVDKSNPRKNVQGKWFGFDFTQPGQGSAWVEDTAEFNVYRELHNSYALAHSRSEIVVDHDDRENKEAAPVDSEAF